MCMQNERQCGTEDAIRQAALAADTTRHLAAALGPSEGGQQGRSRGASYEWSASWDWRHQHQRPTAAFGKPLNRLARTLSPPLPSFASLLAGASSLLEIGCGDGHAMLEAVAQLTPRRGRAPTSSDASLGAMGTGARPSAAGRTCAVGTNEMAYAHRIFSDARRHPEGLAIPLPLLRVLVGNGRVLLAPIETRDD